MLKKNFRLPVLLAFLFLIPFCFANNSVSENAEKASQAYEENDFILAVGYAAQSIFGAAENLKIIWWFSVLLGMILIAIIVFKLSKMLNVPAPDVKKIKKQREDEEFSKIIKSKDDTIDALKSRLLPKNA